MKTDIEKINAIQTATMTFNIPVEDERVLNSLDVAAVRHKPLNETQIKLLNILYKKYVDNHETET